MRHVLISLFLIISLASRAQDFRIPTDQVSIQKGKRLYQDECSRCHDYGKQKIGPSLASVTDKREVKWLLAFINNSQEVIASEDPYAVHLFRSYSNMVMPNFEHLDRSSVLNILAYIQQVSNSPGYDFKKDSVNYYDAEIVDKSEQRYLQPQAEEKDYYHSEKIIRIPMDLESIQKGEELFENQCRTCHEFEQRKTGPALASVTDRRPHQWLIDFIKSPREVLISGDDYANYLVTRYPLVMPDFKQLLSEAEILQVLGYIKYHSGVPTHVAGVNAHAVVRSPDSSAGTSREDRDESGEKTTDLSDKVSNSKDMGSFFQIGGFLLTVLVVGICIYIYIRALRKKS